MKTLIHERVELAKKGLNEKVICKVSSGWVVIGDVQFLHGYCLLLADPVVESLNDLDREKRKYFLNEMSVIGDGLLEITRCKRINYEILGNSEPALHAHIFPRYENEDEKYKRGSVWLYDWGNAPKFNKLKMKEFNEQLLNYLIHKEVVV